MIKRHPISILVSSITEEVMTMMTISYIIAADIVWKKNTIGAKYLSSFSLTGTPTRCQS